MADLDYNKFNWVQSAKERREAIVEEPTGIGAKPTSQQEPMDKGFYESMYDAIMSYFDNAEEADRVLTAKEIDKDRVKGEVLREFDALDSLLSEDTETPSLDYFDGIDRDVMEDTVQAQADRIVDTAGATFEKPSGELIEGFKDVTDTDEGKLTNEEPLYEMAEEIDPGTITTSELSTGKGIMSPVSDDDMGLPDEPSQVEELKDLYAVKGKSYKKSQIKSWSHINDPMVEGGVRGKSRVHGDASIDTQNTVIERIIQKGTERGLSDRDIAIVLAIAKHESGFNPDAAAGTTSARGLGQFIDDTGAAYGITDDNQWDLDTQVDALIDHTLDNKTRAESKGQGEEYIYKYHHDGPTKDYGGLKISKDKVVPLINKFEEYLKSKGERQEPDYPDQTRETSPRPMLRPEEEEDS